jgi:hypothetical protein
MRFAMGLVLVLVIASTVICVAEQVSVQRVEERGNLMVPIRTVFEPFGAQVGWDASARVVTITAPAMNIRLRVNSSVATVDGQRVELPVPPRDIGGQTFVPFSFAVRVLEGKIQYMGDRIEMPTVGMTLLLTDAHHGAVPDAGPPAPPQPAAGHGQLSITNPVDGARIGPRVEIHGTAPARALVIIETEVRRQDDDSLLRVVPGIRNHAPASGNWHFSVAAPVLPRAVAEPLYYVINARYRLGGQESGPVSVRVYRED